MIQNPIHPCPISCRNLYTGIPRLRKMLQYGHSQIHHPVQHNQKDQGTFSCLGLHGEDFGAVEKNLVLAEALEAPVAEGQPAGVLEYRLAGEKLGELPVVTAGTVEKAGFTDYIKKILSRFFWGEREREEKQEEKAEAKST